MPLRVPLGRWLRQSHIQYETYWDEHRLYVRRRDGRFDMYDPFRLSKRIYVSPSEIGTLPRYASPVLVSKRRQILMVPSGDRGMLRSISTPNPDIAGMRCLSQELQILGSYPPRSTFQFLVNGLKTQSLVAATDGSFDPHTRKASGSWILSQRVVGEENVAYARLMEILKSWTPIG